MLVGLVVVIAAVIGGFIMAGGELMVLLQPSEFIVIGGAAIGSLIVSTPVKVIKLGLTQIKGVLGGATPAEEYASLLAMLYQVFKQVQQAGVMSLEAHFEDPAKSTILEKYPKFLARHEAVDFLADSVKVLIVGGIAAHDLEALMDEDLKAHHDEALKPASALTKIGDALPGLGIVAAVLGIVITMKSIDGDAAVIGEHIAGALVGTFLGILLSYGFIGPLSAAMEARVSTDGRAFECVKVGLLANLRGYNPMVSVEFARKSLQTTSRPSFQDLEAHLKSAR